ncbi:MULTISPECIES: helix-turn-helix domain-containing protein [Enterococcus]|uniref:helix-turn-helix domain-containing protein n=1 Tax=Enterococcus TaxID=1350 RepID=UPI000EDF4EAE|nr:MULTISPECIES: helix-turn-helix transcriptional regulator [Enterococcus]HCM84660.1 XRE family transcriptional regulator [Enterococcus sp.]
MYFNEKLKQLRQNREWTQEELADKLFISRTAVSKWESGRGFPSIESLKAISKVFDISIDELLSNRELISIAENDKKRQKQKFQQLLLGILDCMVGLLILLPIFGQARGDGIAFVTMWHLYPETLFLKTILMIFIILTISFGLYELVSSNRERKVNKEISLILTLIGILLFIMTRHPYPATYMLMILATKVGFLLKSQ